MDLSSLQIGALRGYVLIVHLGVLAGLLLGTLARLLAVRKASPDVAEKRLASLKTWWVIAAILSLTLVCGRPGGIVLFALISLLAVREFLTLTRVPLEPWRVRGWIFASVLLNYLWIALDWLGLFTVFIPLVTLVVVPMRMILRDRARGFLLAAGSVHWGLMLTVYGLSHAPLLLTLPASTNTLAGSAGWFLYLLLLTMMNDIIQALVGRRFGRMRVAPELSPNKTWEGLLGGIAGTALLAALLAPLLTPFADWSVQWAGHSLALPYVPAVGAGLLISVGGYFGDLTISGVKRDVGVKDSGHILPGQGGILDRIDSLMFSGPLFYYYVRLLCHV